MRRPSVHQLEIFCHVVRLGSMARAAEVLDLAPPSVSMQLQQLQRCWGVPLLERVGRGVSPTAAGRLLYERARTVLDCLDGIQRDLEELTAGEAGLLKFASSRTIGSYLVPLILRTYERRYPRIDVDYHIVASSERVELTVLERQAEFGLAARVKHTASLAAERLLDEELLVVTAPEHPLSRLRSPTTEHLTRYPLLVREEHVLASDYIRARLEPFPVSPHLVEFESTEAIKEQVLSAAGVAVLPESSIRGELANGSLIAHRLPDFQPRRPVNLVYPREARLSAAARAFFLLAHSMANGGLLGRPAQCD